MDMGQKIRAARLEKGLSQRQLCENLITRNMLSQIENGSAKPSLPTLRELAKRLGQPVQFFLGEENIAAASTEEQNDALLLCWALAAIREQETERAGHLLAAVKDPGSDAWHLAKGCLLAAEGDHSAAAPHLRRGENADKALAWANLEICCRETGDFKGAYEYACRLRQL